MLGVSSQDSERSCVCVLGVSSQDSERSCAYVLGIDFATFYDVSIGFLEMFHFVFHFNTTWNISKNPIETS